MRFIQIPVWEKKNNSGELLSHVRTLSNSANTAITEEVFAKEE